MAAKDDQKDDAKQSSEPTKPEETAVAEDVKAPKPPTVPGLISGDHTGKVKQSS